MNLLKIYATGRDGSFSFLFKDRFVMKTTTKKRKRNDRFVNYENDDEKRNDRFLMEIVLKNGCFQNDR